MSTFIPPVPITLPAGFAYAERPDSRQSDFSLAAKFTQRFQGPYDSVSPLVVARGTTGTPAGTTGTWVVESSGIQKIKGGHGIVTIVWQGYYFLPPDTASFEPENLAPRIERNPVFKELTPLDFSIVQGAAQAPNAAMRNIFTQQLAGTSNPTLATLLYNKFLLGEETYYFATGRYKWTTHYAYGSAPVANMGGYIESPAALGNLPNLASVPATIQFLREADTWSFVGGLQSVIAWTRSWIGGPYGFWDTDIYP